ncbi:TonB-dependent siderophore receptor [Duganella sp. FT80W]|uniref:TonB-dependent siderophore receptor n=1 Tax=Duganella guangzhouensis TaxID=2666084 RepID=A0A6I2L3K8_9BURK|nr:TonB-dependent siderophore receptor [Duganella guangzhouensis]MRW90829.1 TonB-dependent siderophore receptor [Duganella guangzhouensis]
MNKQVKLKRMAVVVSLAMPLLAQAQTADQALPTVQVSSQKLDESTSYTTGKAKGGTPLDLSLRDTPQSVTVVTQQRIEDQGLQTVTDVVNNVIGISVNQYETNRAGFTARGFDIDNLQIDGVPTTWEQSWSSGEVASSLALYDRVEVVRGATGLMTGAGNPSAAINLVRKRATSKELTGSAEIGVGNWNARRAAFDVSTALNKEGTIRGRVVGEYTDSDSWVDLLSNKSKTIYATVEADLAPHTVLDVGFSRQETNAKGSNWGGLSYWYTNGNQTNWDVSKTSAAAWSAWDTSYNNAFVDLNHTFDNGWQLRASVTHGDRRGDSRLLYLYGYADQTTGTGLTPFVGSYLTRTEQTNANVQASGPFQLFGRKHEAAFGYMYSKADFTSYSRAGSNIADTGNYNTWDGSYAEPTWGAATLYQQSVTKQDAVYGVARFSITDPLKLIVGARVTNYKKNQLVVGSGSTEQNDNEVTPYAGLVYDINDTYSAYASYTSIFQPQNYLDQSGKALDPVTGKSSEVGIKGEFLDGKVNASFGLFDIKQDNLGQAGGIDSKGNAWYKTTDGATSRGYEAEVSGELARGWSASAGMSQFRAKDNTGADFNSIYPRKLIRVFTTYNFAGQLSPLTVGGGVNWEGRTWTIDPSAPNYASNGGLIEQKSFALVNLMARYDISKNLSAQLNVNNAFDKTHFGMFAAYGAITYAAPRTTSLTLKYKF